MNVRGVVNVFSYTFCGPLENSVFDEQMGGVGKTGWLAMASFFFIYLLYLFGGYIRKMDV